MNVSELISFLQTQPQDLPVVYECFSEAMMMDADEIKIQELCLPRADGWISNRRPDKGTRTYLVFPGN